MTKVAVLVGAGMLAVLSLSSCADAVCSSGEHPVRWIEDHDGSACVKDGDPPPAGHEEYPAGATPTKA